MVTIRKITDLVKHRCGLFWASPRFLRRWNSFLVILVRLGTPSFMYSTYFRRTAPHRRESCWCIDGDKIRSHLNSVSVKFPTEISIPRMPLTAVIYDHRAEMSCRKR